MNRFFETLTVSTWNSGPVCRINVGDAVEIASGGNAAENYLASVDYFYDIG